MPNVYGNATALPPIAAQWMAADLHLYTFKLHPELWSIPAVHAYFAGKAWSRVSFTEANKATIPQTSGIYMFVAEPRLASLTDHSYIMYVGKATDLRDRYGNYLREKECKLTHNRKDVVKFLNHLNEHLFFHYVQLPHADIELAENLLKDNIDPPANILTRIYGRLAP